MENDIWKMIWSINLAIYRIHDPVSTDAASRMVVSFGLEKTGPRVESLPTIFYKRRETFACQQTRLPDDLPQVLDVPERPDASNAFPK